MKPIAIIFLLLFSAVALGQCSGGTCRAARGPCPAICQCGCVQTGVCTCNLPKPPDVYGWREDASVNPSQVYLYCNGKQVGAWSYEWKQYRPYNAATQTWGRACESPVKVPERPDESRREPFLPPLLPRSQPQSKVVTYGGAAAVAGLLIAFAVSLEKLSRKASP